MDCRPRRRLPALSRAGLLATVGFLLGGPPAAASIEDFESWDLGAREGDDEYGLDSYFLAFSPEWESEWIFAAEGVRSSMGSTVNEIWEMRNEFRFRRDLGPRSRLVYGFVQNQGLTIDDEQHRVGLEVERGGVWFGPFARPHTSKERLDAGLLARRAWSTGTEVQLSLSFEDWNSDHTNGRSGIRDRTYVDFIDPAREWRVRVRQKWSPSRWLALDGAWLPEFRRRFQPNPSSGDPDFLRFLRGSSLSLVGSVDPHRAVALELAAERKVSRVADFPDDGFPAVDLRRDAWRVRSRLTHALPAGLQGRWGLQFNEEHERDRASGARYELGIDDLVATVGLRRKMTSWLTLEGGYGHQQTDVSQEASRQQRRFTWGTRTENRLYVVVELATPGLRCRLIETIELDDEGYDAISDHDKGFVQFQAVF